MCIGLSIINQRPKKFQKIKFSVIPTEKTTNAAQPEKPPTSTVKLQNSNTPSASEILEEEWLKRNNAKENEEEETKDTIAKSSTTTSSSHTEPAPIKRTPEEKKRSKPRVSNKAGWGNQPKGRF